MFLIIQENEISNKKDSLDSSWRVLKKWRQREIHQMQGRLHYRSHHSILWKGKHGIARFDMQRVTVLICISTSNLYSHSCRFHENSKYYRCINSLAAIFLLLFFSNTMSCDFWRTQIPPSHYSQSWAKPACKPLTF